MNYHLLLIALLLVNPVFGQSTLPIIKANSPRVAINDGGYLDKDAWTLSPRAKPDVYTSDRAKKPKWVTFYTDIDSIRVRLKPGATVDFIILLNGKDSCYTRIVSSKSVSSPLKQVKTGHDTIPFTLTKHNAIHVKGIVNKRDTLNLHFDLGSMDFRLTKTAVVSKTKLLANQPDAVAGKTKPDFNRLEKISTLKIGSLIWNNPTVGVANNAARDMDGRFGWRVFDGKTVEIDYDKSLLIVHDRLPKRRQGYLKADIKFIQSLFCVEATINIDSKSYTGDFLFDTGSDLAMILDSLWMSKQQFPTNLTVLKKMSFSDGAGRRYETSLVTVPTLSLNGFVLDSIPTSLLGYKSPVGFQMNYFGNDLLKRFNLIIDLKNDHIYLKPNGLVSVPYINRS
jgi:hypothetical protein